MLFTAHEGVISVAVYFSYELASYWPGRLRTPTAAWVLNTCMPANVLPGYRCLPTSAEIYLQGRQTQPCRARVPSAVDPEYITGRWSEVRSCLNRALPLLFPLLALACLCPVKLCWLWVKWPQLPSGTVLTGTCHCGLVGLRSS